MVRVRLVKQALERQEGGFLPALRTMAIGAGTSAPAAVSLVAVQGSERVDAEPDRRLNGGASDTGTGADSLTLSTDGNEAGFSRFYGESRPKVLRALAVSIGDADLAAEATDEAMARAFQRWAKVSGLDNPGGWVYRVGLNWALTVLRTRRRRSQKPLFRPDPVEMPALVEPALMAAMAQLDVGQRAVEIGRASCRERV